jgi:hypothetical protein
MDGRKDTLTDEAMAREIESALTVEPSPQFVAKVRARVAREPLRAANAGSWRLWLGGAAVMAGAVAVFVWIGAPPATSTRGAAPSSAALATGSEAAAVPNEPAQPAVAPRGVAPAPAPTPIRRPLRRERARLEPSAAQTNEVALPRVLIPENEKRGFELLVTELRDREHAKVVAEATRDLITPGPPWLEIAPVIVEPLRDVGIAQGEGQ